MLSRKLLPSRTPFSQKRSSSSASSAGIGRPVLENFATHNRPYSTSKSTKPVSLAQLWASSLTSHLRSPNTAFAPSTVTHHHRDMYTLPEALGYSDYSWHLDEEPPSIAPVLRRLLDSGRVEEAFWTLVRIDYKLTYDEPFLALVSEIVAKHGLVTREFMDPLEQMLWLKLQQALPNAKVIWLAEDMLRRKRPYEAVVICLNIKSFVFPSNPSEGRYPLRKDPNSDLTDDEAIRLVRTLGRGLRLVDKPDAAVFCFEALIKLEPRELSNYLELLGIWSTRPVLEDVLRKALALLESLPSKLETEIEIVQYKIIFMRMNQEYEKIYDICNNSTHLRRDEELLPFLVTSQLHEAGGKRDNLTEEMRETLSKLTVMTLQGETGSALATIEMLKLTDKFLSKALFDSIVDDLLARDLTLRETEAFFWCVLDLDIFVAPRILNTFDHSIWMRRELGERFMKIHRFDKALSLFRGCMSMASFDASLLVQIGRCLEALHAYKEALAAVAGARLHDESLEILSLAFRLNLKLGDFDAAQAIFHYTSKLKELHPRNEYDRDSFMIWPEMECEWANFLVGNLPIYGRRPGMPRPPTPEHLRDYEAAIVIAERLFKRHMELRLYCCRILVKALTAVGREHEADYYLALDS